MGQVCGCSAAGERLLSAVRDGDAPEVEAIIGRKPRLAKYATFGVRNTALHYAACKGHAEVLSLLLGSGIDVNKTNYCGQTALMHACRFGHWEAVQTLLLHKADPSMRDCINGRSPLHYAATNGQARCIRLLLAVLVPTLMDSLEEDEDGQDCMKAVADMEPWAFAQAVNYPAESGITPLHMAAINKHTEAVTLLLDMGADVHSVTFFDGQTDGVGPGSTPLHYAAAGGSMGCVQALLARGACKKVRNSNGWSPVQVARHWRRPWLEPLLSRQVCTPPPDPPLPLRHQSLLPLIAAMKLAREHGLESSEPAEDGHDACGICLERVNSVSCSGCQHELCTRCALCLCSTASLASSSSNSSGISCPFCRQTISSFTFAIPGYPTIELEPTSKPPEDSAADDGTDTSGPSSQRESLPIPSPVSFADSIQTLSRSRSLGALERPTMTLVEASDLDEVMHEYMQNGGSLQEATGSMDSLDAVGDDGESTAQKPVLRRCRRLPRSLSGGLPVGAFPVTCSALSSRASAVQGTGLASSEECASESTAGGPSVCL